MEVDRVTTSYFPINEGSSRKIISPECSTTALPQSVDSHERKWKTFNVTAPKFGGGGVIGLNSQKGSIDIKEVGPRGAESVWKSSLGWRKGGEGALFYHKNTFYEA